MDINQLNVVDYIKNVAVYARKSRGEDERDLDKHTMVMKELCEHYSWNYIFYPEIGSGESIQDRPKMIELLNDIESEMFDAVVVMDYDRLGRGSGTDQDTIRFTLRDSGTLVVEANPFNILNPNNERDESMIDFKGFMANQEYKMISKRLASGRKFALKMGRWVNGSPPYGYYYDRDKKALGVDKEQSEIFRELIVKSYLNGKSSSDIAWNLNKMNIPSPRNGLWSNNTILNLLKSEVYLGHIVYNKSSGVRKSQSKSISKKPFKKKEKSEWITVHNCHPSLISQEDFYAIQDIISKKKTSTGTNGVNSLSGLVKCYNCGSTMTVQKSDDGSQTIKKCRGCQETKGGDISIIEVTIITSVSAMKQHLLKESAPDDNAFAKKELLLEVEKLEAKVDVHERAIAKIEEAYEDGLYTVDKTKEKLKFRRDAIYEIEEILRRKKESLNNFKMITNKERIKRIDQFLKEIEMNDNPKELNRIYKSIIDSIIWKREKTDEIEVTVNFL